MPQPQCPIKSSAGKARLLDHVAGRLDTAAAARLAAHLRTCDACTRFAADQSAVWNLLDEWKPEGSQPSFNRGVYGRIDKAGPERLAARLARAFASWIPRPALTIPFAAMLLLGSLCLDRPIANVPPAPATPVTQAVTTGDAEQLTNALDDLQLLHQLDLVKDEAPDASRSM